VLRKLALLVFGELLPLKHHSCPNLSNTGKYLATGCKDKKARVFDINMMVPHFEFDAVRACPSLIVSTVVVDEQQRRKSLKVVWHRSCLNPSCATTTITGGKMLRRRLFSRQQPACCWRRHKYHFSGGLCLRRTSQCNQRPHRLRARACVQQRCVPLPGHAMRRCLLSPSSLFHIRCLPPCSPPSVDGQRLISGGKDGRLYFFDVETAQPIMLIQRVGWTTSIELSRDGMQFLTCSQV
jgi:WD40 repeat protein